MFLQGISVFFLTTHTTRTTMIGIHECPICFHELPADSRFVLTPCCRQLFCSECCAKAIRFKNICPFCKEQLLKTRTDPAYGVWIWIPLIVLTILTLLGIVLFVVLVRLK